MEHFLSSWGYLALALLTVAEAACIPFPSEVTVGFAGYLASTGRLDLAAVIALGTAGETVGALIGYGIGRFGGRRLVDRFGRYVLLSHEDLDRAQRWFDRRGEWSVLVGRVVPLVRTFIALPAGVAQMQPVRFTLLTCLGSLVWIGALAGAGYGLGGQWHRLTHGFSVAGYVLFALAVVAIAGFVFLRWRRVRADRNQSAASKG
ncbi:MAG TPA: DedA family protein [Acidimicrobiales bacterium]|nr:DedA family protein [Acidimicrobiales bacterium]